MEHNVYSFKTAIRKSYELRLYIYDPQQIPLGEFDAVLECKTWSKRIIAINCYFTKTDTKEKFVVTVYCNNQTGKYVVPGSAIDFSHCPTGVAYTITVCKNDKGRIILSKAEHSGLSGNNK